MTMRATLIHNPDAGDDHQPTAGQLKALLKEAGYKVRYRSTRKERWWWVLRKYADLVIVAGGDGTVGKVARRLIGTGVPLAVLPMGTANNIARTLGIADFSITRLIATLRSARRLSFDAGLAIGPWGERHFIEGVGIGLLTCSIPELEGNKTIGQLGETGVRVTYAQQIFREQLADCPAVAMEATLDGEDISGRYLLFEVLNMAYIGPNLFLAPDMVRNDGKFDVVLVAEKHRGKLHRHIKDWQEGKPWPAEFGTCRGRRLKIKWTGFSVHVDDKLWPEKRKRKPQPHMKIVITIERRAVVFLVPREVEEMRKLQKKNAARAAKRARGKKKPVSN